MTESGLVICCWTSGSGTTRAARQGVAGAGAGAGGAIVLCRLLAGAVAADRPLRRG
jgi:hypothetical protein